MKRTRDDRKSSSTAVNVEKNIFRKQGDSQTVISYQDFPKGRIECNLPSAVETRQLII